MTHGNQSSLSRALLGATAMVLVATSGQGAAFAQEDGADAPEDGQQDARVYDKVVITARRREENLSDVPVAVSAFGEDQIAELGIDSEADLQIGVPGLQVRVTNSSNQLNYSLRGQSVDSFSNSQPAVLAYINEVQAGGVVANSFFDMGSIQVLKGPQGTLFGRNATGGAVLYETKKPENEFGGYAKVGLGSFEERVFEGALNVPLGENFAARLSGLSREREGWQTNLYNGDKLASIDSQNIRLSLSYDGSTISNDFMAYYGTQGGKTEGLRVRNAYNCLATAQGVCIQGEPNPNNPSVNVGDLLFATELYPEGVIGTGALIGDNPRLVELAAQYGFTGFRSYIDTAGAQLDFDQVLNDANNDSDIDSQLFTNSTEFRISDNMTVKNIIGFNKVESFQGTDVDGSPFMLLRIGDEFSDNGGYQYNLEQFSEELQISGDTFGGRLEYIAGVYYYMEENDTTIPLKFIADYFNDPFGPAFKYHALIEDESTSAFAQINYDLTEKLTLTLGGRYTWEEVSIQHFEDSAYFAAGVVDKFTQKADKPSWLVSLDYRINDENLVYITHRGSWRTGGYNITSINTTPNGLVPDSFLPEETQDVEVGWKYNGYLGDVPARINLAAYQQVVDDVQRTVYLQITSLTGNVEQAKVKGVEIDGQFSLTDWLDVGAAYAYTDAEYNKPFGDVVGYNFPFGPYADAPENQTTLWAKTQTNLGQVGDLTFRVDYYMNDDTFFSSLNDTIAPGTELDGYELLNLRLALENINGSNLSAVAFVRNATDAEYERGGLPLGGVTATNATIAGEPRTVGFELRYDF